MSIFDEGYEAYYEEEDPVNPYSMDSWKYGTWERGYFSASFEVGTNASYLPLSDGCYWKQPYPVK